MSGTGSSPEVPSASRLGTAERRAPRAAAAPALSAADVVVAYGGTTAVDGVSIEMFAGEILGLIGPNGAGKSSLLAALGGQMKLRRGSIRLGGRDVTRSPGYSRARLGVARTFQTTSEFEGMTVFENLLVAGRGARGASLWYVSTRWSSNRREDSRARDRAWQVLDRFDMAGTADAYAQDLSGGQRRLVEIMRCLMREPSVLLLDEPMVGVAPHLVTRLVSDLRSIAADGIAVLVVEHALEVVAELCDSVVVMALGRVIASGSYDEVVADEGVRDAYLA